MRWLLGPPHQTLKPSPQKKQKRAKPPKNTKMSFSVISRIFFFGGGGPNVPFLTTWSKQRAPKKHYKNRGFSKAFFEKQMCITKRPLLDQENKPEIPIIVFSSLSTTKTQTLLKPLVCRVLANLKKEIFQKLNLKQRTLEKSCTHFWKKG